MKIIWHEEAKKGRWDVSKYIRKCFGSKRMDVFVHEVHQSVQMLKQYPNIGPIDPLFEKRPATYRSIIIGGLSKMVYRIDEDRDTIHIVAFWDCRQEPKINE